MPSLANFCPYCDSYNLAESLEPPNSNHHGRVTCGDCQHFIKWQPKPKTNEECENRQQLINQALDTERLTGWEAFFFREIRDRRTLSPKQLQKYNQICSRHNLIGKNNPATHVRG